MGQLLRDCTAASAQRTTPRPQGPRGPRCLFSYLSCDSRSLCRLGQGLPRLRAGRGTSSQGRSDGTAAGPDVAPQAKAAHRGQEQRDRAGLGSRDGAPAVGSGSLMISSWAVVWPLFVDGDASSSEVIGTPLGGAVSGKLKLKLWLVVPLPTVNGELGSTPDSRTPG